MAIDEFPIRAEAVTVAVAKWREVGMIRLRALAIATFLLAPSTFTVANAQIVQASTLHSECKAALRVADKRGDREDVISGISCVAWMNGFLGGFFANGVLETMAGRTPVIKSTCFPIGDIKPLQMAALVAKLGDEDPTELSGDAEKLALSALMKYYPCSRPSGQ